MSILTWIDDNERLKLLNASKYIRPSTDSNKGLWTRCDKCGVILYIKHLIENQRVCFGCAYHLQMNSPERIKNLLDKDSWRPFDETVSPCDPLEFHDQKNYTDRLQAAQDKTGLQDAIQTGSGRIEGIPVALGVMDFDFMGGSMGSVVGEKITRLIEYATQEGLTLILICASGGARMQEGVFGLMQMAKISSALRIYQSCAKLLYISILTSPTTGGVTASFGMLGDIIFAEPRALIAFAGRRVIEQTLCEDLPEDFQSSEYMLNHGLVDLIVPRRFLRQALSESIKFYKNAPFKRTGKIPFGVENPISFITEEKVRRQWKGQAKWEGQVSEHSSSYFQSTNTSYENFANKKSHDIDSSFSTKNTNLLSNKTEDSTAFELDKQENGQELKRDGFTAPIPADNQMEASDLNLKTLGLPLLESKNRFKSSLRHQSKYRDILTSFQMIFHLFDKQSVLPDSNNVCKSEAFAQRDVSISANDFIQQESLLQRFGYITTRLKDLGNLDSAKQTFEEDSVNVDSLLSGKEAELADTKNHNQELSLVTGAEKDIDFLNQAIELAATESIEWRAFYVSQLISKTTAEDFFQPEVEGTLHSSQTVRSFVKTNNTVLHNKLFYKSVCRSTSR